MIEEGKRVPSLEVLTKLADIFYRDISYFITDKEPDFSVNLRAQELKEKDKKELFIKLSDNYTFLEEATEEHSILSPVYPDPPSEALNNYKSLHDFAEEIANYERRRLGLGQEPIKDFFTLIETQEAHVIRKELIECRIYGAFIFNHRKGAFILINSAITKGRQVFTAAHEYCHYLKDRDKAPRLIGFII